ncbi:MAG: hypothetical protein AAGC77_11620 [Pseudomonadota bacterium]
MTSMFGNFGARYDAAPAHDTPLYGGPVASFVFFFVDLMRGICAGVLGMLGGTHLTQSASTLSANGAIIDPSASFWEQIAAGGLSGPIELIGAVALFLSARGAIARTLGVLLFVAFMVAYTNGYTAPDMIMGLSTILAQIADGLYATQTASLQ